VKKTSVSVNLLGHLSEVIRPQSWTLSSVSPVRLLTRSAVRVGRGETCTNRAGAYGGVWGLK